jgi:anaerobic ribonucleoside-triphosphate reductase
VGINEMVQSHYGKQVYEDNGALRLAVRAMTEMELYAKELSEREGMTISFSRTPAETVVQRFAVADILNKEFRDKALSVVNGDVERALARIHETRDLPIYYTNGTHVPPNADVTLAERIKIEHIFFPIVDGGNIMHIFLGEGYPDPRGVKSLAMKIAETTQTGYYAFTKDMTVCKDCAHVTMGLMEACEKCNSDNLDYISRITGYLQAVSGWNEGKKQELMDRMRYGGNEIR